MHDRAPPIADLEAPDAIDLGIATDRQIAEVVHPMMAGAEGHQVVGIGSTAVFPMADVMDVQTGSDRTAGYDTTRVAILDEVAQSIGNDPLSTTDGDRSAL